MVFKAGKKSLKFDLAVIGAVQSAALAYGVFALLSGRPVYIAAVGYKFDLIQANEISDEQLAPVNASLPLWGPIWVGTKPATDKNERERIMFSGLAGGDYGHFPQYHAPLETMRDEILQNAKPISQLRNQNQSQNHQFAVVMFFIPSGRERQNCNRCSSISGNRRGSRDPWKSAGSTASSQAPLQGDSCRKT